MKHQFILTPSRLTAYCSCGYFAVECESSTPYLGFELTAELNFERHVTLEEEFVTQPEPATTA